MLMTIVCLAGFGSTALAQRSMNPNFGDKGGQGNPGVIPPNALVMGKSYGDWGAAWWQWALSIPFAVNPMNDQTGANAAQGQAGPVWFLAGTFCVDINAGCALATATRTCTVPTGKHIFFPILNSECSTFEGNGTTYQELRDCARSSGDIVTGMVCEVDGVPLQNLQAYRATSGLFTWGPLPDGNILEAFGLPNTVGATSPAAQDGYYIMLAPLSAGPHTIHFAGSFGSLFALDVTYHLTAARIMGATQATLDGALPTKPVTWGAIKTIYR
jgi:hypothetical protein